MNWRHAYKQKRTLNGSTTTIAHDGSKFTDLDIARYVRKHLRFRDRFSIDKIVVASLMAFDVFLKEGRMSSKKPNWKFFTGDAEFKWNEEPD